MASVKATKTGSGLLSRARALRPHLLTHGVSAEVMDVRSDLARALGPEAAITVDEFVTPAAGSLLELSQVPMARTGGYVVLHEVVDGAALVPPTGTIKVTNGVGTYTPAAAPDGQHKFAVYYERDPGASRAP
ncbi:hypothetical protein LVJ94_34955 [Pendulispora rubella]|uniref:Uncharacterized protein n=1 Tax=Pendulispora rubella TaxID=2741070 RepID=A0ABZ2KX17_9BACT